MARVLPYYVPQAGIGLRPRGLSGDTSDWQDLLKKVGLQVGGPAIDALAERIRAEAAAGAEAAVKPLATRALIVGAVAGLLAAVALARTFR